MTDPATSDAIRAARMDAASQTARVLAHEIANHLGTMRTMLYLLGDELGPDPKAAEDLGVVARTVDGATQLVEALRAFAHAPLLGAGPSDLNAALRGSEAALRSLLSPGRTLALELSQDALIVAADTPRLAALALELVGALSRALPVGGRLSVATERAPGAGGAPAALLAVRDDGPGLDPDRAARFFEPFVFDLAHDGGMRLPTLYNTVTRSGGSITAESAPGAGTSIRVTLPLAAGAR